MTEGRFAGKVALITGAGSGIGRAVTLRLTAEGGTVFAVDIDEGRAKETAELASSAPTVHAADVSSPEACRAAVDACVAAHGRLDVLGNIAGIARAEHVTDVTVEQYRQLMGVNVDACFFLAQAAIPHLLETSGNIVNIASNAGLMGQAYTVAYCMSKGAIVQMTKALAMEFVKTPLRVNAIAPGGTSTTLTSTFQIPPDVDFELMGRYTGFRPMAEADDIASLFSYVASDEARAIHGAILSADNGITAG
jgi:meso-butanediol dehydrogenase / (S,S)-butanediol dehydrogenase / diacetyl reductase